MKLTNSDRDAFVSAVMSDVPLVDHSEQARKIVLAAAAAKLPKELKPIWADTNLRGFIGTSEHFSMPYPLGTARVPPVTFTPPKELEGLAEAAKAQSSTRDALRRKVRAVISGCSTLKQATERLPEFVKYLPWDRNGSSTVDLPAIANVVTDLLAAGWPKGKKSTIKK